MLKFMNHAAIAMALFAVSPFSWAEQAYPAIELLSTNTTVLGEAIHYPTDGPARVTVSVVTILPGAEAIFHRHPVPLVGYILEGELTVDYVGRGTRVFRKGEAMVEAMNVTHRGMNLGKETVRILATYLGAEGVSNVVLEKQPGGN